MHIVGWQPLPRPEQQRAFVVKMKPGQDFTSLPSVETFHFQHEAHISYHIWNAFDQGKALFPTDAAAELARRAESLSEFTESQIERAWRRLAEWTAETAWLPTHKRPHSAMDTTSTASLHRSTI